MIQFDSKRADMTPVFEAAGVEASECVAEYAPGPAGRHVLAITTVDRDRPVAISGGGVFETFKQVTEFCARWGVPVHD